MYSQGCNSNTEYSTYDSTNTGFVERVSTTVSPGEYITVTGILENQYTFTASHTSAATGIFYNDYITIRNTDNVVLRFISWVAQPASKW